LDKLKSLVFYIQQTKHLHQIPESFQIRMELNHRLIKITRWKQREEHTTI